LAVARSHVELLSEFITAQFPIWSSAMGVRSEVWLIKPLACPRLVRYCSACTTAQEFVCSERFRINAQKKLMDVWLHYRCNTCGDAWKYPVLERQSIASLDAATYEAYVRHDATTVWKYAFDLARIRTYVTQVIPNVEVVVERRVVEGVADAEELSVHLELPFVCDLRLDRLLAMELQMSRTTIQRWYEQNRLRVWPEQSGALSKRIRTGQRLLLTGMAGHINL
jgi:hypothetical protein